MKLYSRDQYCRLRHSVRWAVKARPEWRAAAHRAGPGQWRWPLGTAGLRWLVPLLFIAPAVAQPPSRTLWLILAVWTLVMACFRCGQAQQLSAGRDGVSVFFQFPIGAREVLRFITTRVVRSSWWLFADVLIALSIVCLAARAPANAWFGVLLGALLLWASALATAVLLLSWRPQINYARWASAFLTVGMIGVSALHETRLFSPARIETFYRVLSWATPPGWATQVAAWAVGAEPAFPVVAAGLLALTLALAVPCYRAMAARYVFWEPEELPFSRPDDEDEEHPPEPPRESGVSEVEERLRERTFLVALTDFESGWIERLILPAFSSRAALLDFLLGTAPGWSAAFRTAVILLLATPLLAALAGLMNMTAAYWVLGIGLFSALSCSTPLFGGTWRGFDIGPMGSRYVAVLAFFPVGLRECRRIIFAINLRRFLLALPCWLVAGCIVAWVAGHPVIVGLRWGGEMWLGVLLLGPFFLVFKYSQGTNDTSSGCLSVLMIYSLGLLVVLAAGMAVLATFLPALWPWHLAAFVALAATSFGFEAIYRRLYCGQRFDLLAKSGNETM